MGRLKYFFNLSQLHIRTKMKESLLSDFKIQHNFGETKCISEMKIHRNKITLLNSVLSLEFTKVPLFQLISSTRTKTGKKIKTLRKIIVQTRIFA